jgi:hypothetical protein
MDEREHPFFVVRVDKELRLVDLVSTTPFGRCPRGVPFSDIRPLPVIKNLNKGHGPAT